MEPLSALGLLGLTGYGMYRAANWAARQSRLRTARQNANVVDDLRTQHARLRSQREHAQQSQQYRQMQLAMLHLDQEPDPDFRRAASAARAARGVAANLRQRQYGRLRPMLVQHYRRCRSRGTAAEILLESLVELVEALGMPEYEADYIRQEAERTQQTRPTASPVDSVQEFQQRLSQAQQEHEQRIQAIRTLSGLNDDTRAQLLEAEEQRYQSRLFGGRDS